MSDIPPATPEAAPSPAAARRAGGAPAAVRHGLTILLPAVAVFAVAPRIYPNGALLFAMMTFLVLAQGINVIFGFTGYLPFGYVGFFGTGAYAASLALLRLHLAWPLAMLAGAVAAALLALLLMPLLRLSGAYFAIASLAAAEAMYQLVSNPALVPITNGPYGLSLQAVYDGPVSYGAMVGVLALTLAILIYLRTSRFGLALQAIRDDPASAATAGVDVVRSRALAWLLSALMAGLAGGVYAWHVSVFYPDTVFDLSFTVFAIVFVLFGGPATILGPLFGTLALYGLYDAIGISTPQYFQFIYGLLIVVLVLFLPEGLVSLLRRRGIRVP
ncbi:MAG: branched-chain amino acid ABC transporter permease [Firmicutes bacterium]|nr:branched-chain amino acid ABC transporter permease [Bacillota bacterium]